MKAAASEVDPARISRLKTLAWAAAVVVTVLALYGPVYRAGFIWDDDAHITRPELRSLHGLWRIWFELGATQQYYPVLHSAFWIEHRLWGDAAWAYHLLNVLLHATAACLFAGVLRRVWIRSTSHGAEWFAAFLFAVHPVCVESVAWISEQKNTLSAVFYLGTALIYLRFDETRGRILYSCAFGLFALALLTKTVTATLPAALLVVFWWRRGRLGWRRDVVPLLPWLAVGAACGLFTAWDERKLIGAEGADFSLAAPQRALLAGRVIVFYAGKIICPSNLMFIYPRWTISGAQFAQYLCVFGVLALLAALVLVARKWRGPLAGFLFFTGTLFPVLGFVNVYPFIFSFVADHFQYLASVGILVPVAWGLDRIAAGIPMGARGRACLVLAVPALLGFLSWRQCRIYTDADTLNRATLARNPAAWLAHYNLAVSLGRNPDRQQEAISEYEATLRLKPDHWAAHSNLGSALLKLPGREADAIAEYEAALRINPDFADAHNNLGIALGRIPGRLPEAISHVSAALRIQPDNDAAHYNLANLLMQQPGSSGEAIGEYEAALRLAPDNPEYHLNLANALALAPGRLSDSVAEYREALRLRPNYMKAHSDLGAALAHMPGHDSEAISEFEAAIRLGPENAQVRASLANALAKVPGRAADAAAEYSAALRIDPNDAQTHVDFGAFLSGIPGRLPDAVVEFKAAVRLKPESAVAHYCLAVGLLGIGGSRDEAAEHLERALEIRPGFEQARRVLGDLRTAGR